MRLYSYGYRRRGVGAYCTRVATALLPHLRQDNIYIWGNPDLLPESLRSDNITIISYRSGSWKHSIVSIPYIVVQHHIDLIHYWIALGPLHAIGLSPVPLAPAIATVHDLGVENWDTPYGNAVKKRPFWKMQKMFLSTVDGVQCNSIATCDNLRPFFKKPAPGIVVYPPYIQRPEPVQLQPKNREHFFITLGGSPHKNGARTIAAFLKFRKLFPRYTLKILGDINPEEEHLTDLPAGVVHEPHMKNYLTYLNTCSGLLCLSLNEGLGIPPLEALDHSCPLLLSSIPSHHETCNDAALFANPNNQEEIAERMIELVKNNDHYVRMSRQGAGKYQQLATESISNCLTLYRHFIPGSISRKTMG